MKASWQALLHFRRLKDDKTRFVPVSFNIGKVFNCFSLFLFRYDVSNWRVFFMDARYDCLMELKREVDDLQKTLFSVSKTLNKLADIRQKEVDYFNSVDLIEDSSVDDEEDNQDELYDDNDNEDDDWKSDLENGPQWGDDGWPIDNMPD